MIIAFASFLASMNVGYLLVSLLPGRSPAWYLILLAPLSMTVARGVLESEVKRQS